LAGLASQLELTSSGIPAYTPAPRYIFQNDLLGRIRMKNLLLLAVLAVGALFVAGAIHIQKGTNDIEITVDKQKAEQVAEKALEEGRTVLQEVEQSVQQSAQQPSSNGVNR
jgi:hypothetical protein